MFADKMTKSMQRTIDETERRRKLQMAYNEKHGLVPTPLQKSKEGILESTKVADGDSLRKKSEVDKTVDEIRMNPKDFLNGKELDKEIKRVRKHMEKAAKNLDFIEAAGFRDQMRELQKLQKTFK
jgi:excinuclease ABC subunit B